MACLKKNCNIYIVGRHIYWTNVYLNVKDIHQDYDFKQTEKGCYCINKDGHRQGGKNVAEIIEIFLKEIHK